MQEPAPGLSGRAHAKTHAVHRPVLNRNAIGPISIVDDDPQQCFVTLRSRVVSTRLNENYYVRPLSVYREIHGIVIVQVWLGFLARSDGTDTGSFLLRHHRGASRD